MQKELQKLQTVQGPLQRPKHDLEIFDQVY